MTTKRNSAKSKTKSRRKGRPRGTTVRRWVRERLKRIRDEEGMTQDDMAGRIEISTQKYGEIERRSDARCDHQTAKKIASVLGVTVSDLRSNQRHRLDVHQAAINSPTPAGQDDCRDSLFPDPIIERFLASYYTEDVLRRGCLEKFSVQVGELSRTTSVATKPHWLRFAWKLDAPTEQCNYVGEHHRLRDYKDILAPRSSIYEVCFEKVYELRDLDVDMSSIKLRFGITPMLSYLDDWGGFYDELSEALFDCDSNVDEIIRRKHELLPLRTTALCDGKTLLNFADRCCPVSVETVLAIARPQPFDDFVLLLERISKSGRVVPSVFRQEPHRPITDAAGEANISFQSSKCVYSRVFVGEEASLDTRWSKPDWWRHESEPMRWLLKNRSSSNFECVGIGVNLLDGGIKCSVLYAVHDASFWSNYQQFLNTWQLESRGILPISSRDTDALSQLLGHVEWYAQGLFTFVEAMRRLEVLHPDKVALPDLRLLGELAKI